LKWASEIWCRFADPLNPEVMAVNRHHPIQFKKHVFDSRSGRTSVQRESCGKTQHRYRNETRHGRTMKAEGCAKETTAYFKTHGWLGVEKDHNEDGTLTVTGIAPGVAPADHS
jgi:hypothetical protein